MEIPVHILWGMAGFTIVSFIRDWIKNKRDLDAAFFQIREMKEDILILKGKKK